MSSDPQQSSETAPEPKKKGRFEPKEPVNLDPPKDDPISKEYLAKCDGWETVLSYLDTGTNAEYPTLVAIKGKVYDVSGNKAYGPDGGYRLFAGHDASRALAKTSLKQEDVKPDWHDLPDSEKTVLDDWVTYFSKRYNVIGVVEGADNM